MQAARRGAVGEGMPSARRPVGLLPVGGNSSSDDGDGGGREPSSASVMRLPGVRMNPEDGTDPDPGVQPSDPARDKTLCCAELKTEDSTLAEKLEEAEVEAAGDSPRKFALHARRACHDASLAPPAPAGLSTSLSGLEQAERCKPFPLLKELLKESQSSSWMPLVMS